MTRLPSIRENGGFVGVSKLVWVDGRLPAFQSLFLLVELVAGSLEFALPRELFPDGQRILVGRRDGHDARGVALSAHVNPRLVVEQGRFQAILEGLHRRVEFLRA